MKRMIPLLVLVSVSSAQEDPLSEYLAAEAAFRRSLRQRADLPRPGTLRDALAGLAADFEVPIELDPGHAELEVDPSWAEERFDGLWPEPTLRHVVYRLAQEAELHVHFDPLARTVRIGERETLDRQRLVGALGETAAGALLTVPEALPRVPEGLCEVEPGRFRWRIGAETLSFSGRDGPLAIGDAVGAVVVQDCGEPPPGSEEWRILALLDEQHGIDLDRTLADRRRRLFLHLGLRTRVTPKAARLGAADRGPAVFRDATLRTILRDTAAMWDLDFAVRDGSVLIRSPEELVERRVHVRCFGPDGAERWSESLRLAGPARLLGLRVDGSLIALYTAANAGTELRLYRRGDGRLFMTLPLE